MHPRNWIFERGESGSAFQQSPKGKRSATDVADAGLESQDALNAEEQRAVADVFRVIVVGDFGANQEVVVHLVGRSDCELGEARAALHFLAADTKRARDLGVEVVAVEREPVVTLVTEAAVLV